ncbi:MAG: peptidoglycan DD-metalloendopeptidase family protein [Candidatus Margulisbacteria bacterium]|nr:peptidoglycan DD-metalloendopeptidase family protein [Candidatus Margulisiibacteriota bacterium]
MVFRKFFLGLILVLACGAAESIAEKQKELERLQAEIQRNQQLIRQTKIQENASLRDLSLLNRSISRVKNTLDYNQKRLQEHTAELQQASLELEARNTEYAGRSAAARARVREMYKIQDLGWLTLLLSDRSFSALADNAHHYYKILEQDRKNILELRALKRDISGKKENLEYQKKLIESTKKSIEQQKTLYEQRAKKQEQIGAALRVQRLAYEKREDTLLKNSKEIENLIKKMLRSGASEARGTGKYIWPLKGVLTSQYGRRFHPVFKVWRTHSGIDIAAASGTPIKAADSGVVILSAWHGGYGRAIVVDHGKGFATLYGHLSKQNVKEGDKVNKGQVIGLAGSSGVATGPHLHFEIRIDGETTDPLPYLPPQ